MWWLVDVKKTSVKQVSDGPSEILVSSDGPAVNSPAASAAAGSTESSRRGRRNRRDRHKNVNRTTGSAESVMPLMDTDPHVHAHPPPSNLADPQSSGRSRSYVINSSASSSSSVSGSGREMTSKVNVMDPVKLTACPVCPPAAVSSSITGNCRLNKSYVIISSFIFVILKLCEW